jgi:hypothetical protein
MNDAERRPWYRLAPASEAWDEDLQVARWLAYAHANMLAFDAATIAGDTRRAVDYLQRAIPAFAAAALTRGWTPERAWSAACDGDTMTEVIWEWLSNYGIIPSQVAPIEVAL